MGQYVLGLTDFLEPYLALTVLVHAKHFSCCLVPNIWRVERLYTLHASDPPG